MLKGQQAREHGVECNTDTKTVRLGHLMDKCCTEGLLDWKALEGYDDCQWCPYKTECDRIWDECDLCSYMEGRTKLKAVFALKHKWAKTHSTADLVKQTVR